MRIKSMSNTRIVIFLSLIVLTSGALFYGIFSLLGADEKSKVYLLIGTAIAFVFYIGGTIIKLKKDGVLYDERDGYIEKETDATSFSIFQFILVVIGLLTYKSGEIKINISGVFFLLFTVMWIVHSIVYFLKKKKS